APDPPADPPVLFLEKDAGARGGAGRLTSSKRVVDRLLAQSALHAAWHLRCRREEDGMDLSRADRGRKPGPSRVPESLRHLPYDRAQARGNLSPRLEPGRRLGSDADAERRS